MTTTTQRAPVRHKRAEPSAITSVAMPLRCACCGAEEQGVMLMPDGWVLPPAGWFFAADEEPRAACSRRCVDVLGR